jgi:hypothetical protein
MTRKCNYVKYTKCPKNILNGRIIYQHFPFQGPPQYSQIGIFVSIFTIWQPCYPISWRDSISRPVTPQAETITPARSRLQGNYACMCVCHKNLRSGSGMHLCMQDDQNGQKTMVLPSAEKTRLTHFILSKKKYF